jgi:hypothetical protein
MTDPIPEIDTILERDNTAPNKERPGDEEISQGPSGFGDSETSQGGADAVPDTPDDVPEDFT